MEKNSKTVSWVLIGGVSTFGLILLIFLGSMIFSYLSWRPAWRMEELANRELRIGSSSEEIEKFFDRHHLKFGWNEDFQRYEWSDPDPTKDIHMIIQVDKDKKLLNVHVTGPEWITM